MIWNQATMNLPLSIQSIQIDFITPVAEYLIDFMVWMSLSSA